VKLFARRKEKTHYNDVCSDIPHVGAINGQFVREMDEMYSMAENKTILELAKTDEARPESLQLEACGSVTTLKDNEKWF
jgi:hypothetical protein